MLLFRFGSIWKYFFCFHLIFNIFYVFLILIAGEELCSLIGVCPQQDTGVSLLTVREQVS